MLANFKKSLLIAFAFCALTACNTMQTATADKHDKKVIAAGINVQLGMAYLEKHEIQRAKQKFLLALHEAPQLPEVWYSLGYFFELTGDKPRSTRCYLRALELAPKRGDTNNNYGTYLCRSHQYKAAIKHFLIATQDIEYLETASAYENAGLCAQLIPAPKLAEQYFEAALRQDPNRPMSLLGLAEVTYEQKEYQQSTSYLNQFLTLSPAIPESKALSDKLRKKGVKN